MVPTLFPSDECYYVYLGKGKLTDVISCIVHEELNGEYSLTMEYPVTGPMLEDLYAGGTISVIAPTYSTFNDGFDSQFFDIYKHTVPINGVVTFYANHVSRRLADIAHVAGFIKATGMQTILQCNPIPPVNGIDFYGSGVYDTRTARSETPASGLAKLIGAEDSIHTHFGYDFAFDCSTPSQAGDNRTWKVECNIVTINHRGQDRGVKIRFGYDLMDINYTHDKTGTYNALVPYWTKPNGDFVTPTPPVVQPSTPITPLAVVPYDANNDFETEPTSAALTALAQSILDNTMPWIDSETIEADFLNGAEIDPHGARVYLGDTVTVEWIEARISKQMRAISYDYDVLAERFIKITLGTQEHDHVVTSDSLSGGVAASGSGGGGFAMALYLTSVPCSAMTGNFVDYNDGSITADYVVAECVFASPSAITTDVSWTTSAGNIKLNGTCSSATTCNIVLVSQ